MIFIGTYLSAQMLKFELFLLENDLNSNDPIQWKVLCFMNLNFANNRVYIKMAKPP
jgi:hypothetical protein